MEVLKGSHAPELLPRTVLTVVERFSQGHLVDDLAALCVSAEGP